MATVQPGPSSGGTGLNRTRHAPGTAPPAGPPLHPQPGGRHPHYSVLLSTGS
jgi:hypothetical protein